MKIVFESNGDRYIDCLASAASVIDGIDVFMWNPKVKNELDMLYEINPDIVAVGENNSVNQKAIDFGKRKYNFIYTVREELPCINVAQIAGGKMNKANEADVSFILSDFYKSTPLFNIMMDYVSQKYNHKIYGSYCDRPQYLGGITMKERSNILASSKVVIDITQKFAYMDCYYFSGLTMAYGEPNPLDTHVMYYSNMDNFIEAFDILMNNPAQNLRLEESSFIHLSNFFKGLGVDDSYSKLALEKNKEFYQ